MSITRQSIAALALICRKTAGEALWLAHWNRGWKAFSFVGGHKRPEESFRECVAREIGEEIGLVEGQDFGLAEDSLSRLTYTAFSERAKQETEYTIEVFDVELLENSATRKLDDGHTNRWLTEKEIQARRCTDEMPVSKTMCFVLSELGLVDSGE